MESPNGQAHMRYQLTSYPDVESAVEAWRWAKGIARPSVEQARRLDDFLGLPLEDFAEVLER